MSDIKKIDDGGHLKPCPFCGGNAEHMSTSSSWIRCEDCCAEIQCQETKEDAVRMWNRRAHQPDDREAVNVYEANQVEIERLRAALTPFAFTKNSLNFDRFDDGNTAWVAVDGAGSDRVYFFVGDVLRARAVLSSTEGK